MTSPGRYTTTTQLPVDSLNPHHHPLVRQAFWGVIYLGLAASCLAYLLQFYLLQTIGTLMSAELSLSLF